MSIDMLGKIPLSEVQGPMDDLQRNLAGERGEDWFAGFELFLQEEPTRVTPKLLELVGEVKVPAVKKFIVAEKFRKGKTNDKVPIHFIGKNFCENFLGLIEDSVPATSLKIWKLLDESVDSQILSELGGKRRSKIKMASFFKFLKKETRKHKNKDGRKWFFSYICDQNETLWLVRARRNVL